MKMAPMDSIAFVQVYLGLIVLLAGCLSPVEGQMAVNILPVSAAVGAPYVLQLFGRTAFTALVAMVARNYGIAAERVTLIFGGQILEGVRRLSDIPGFQSGHTILLHVRAVISPVVNVAPIDDEIVDAARRAHDVNWGRVQNLVVGRPPHTDPNLPNHQERNYILTVAMILTRGIDGIVNARGLAREEDMDSNVILGIMYYYKCKGWPLLREQFVKTVFDNM